MKQARTMLVAAAVLLLAAYCPAADPPPATAPAVDMSTPVGTAKAFIQAFDTGDLALARRVLSKRILDLKNTDEKLTEFLTMFKNEGKVLEILGADEPKEDRGALRCRVKVRMIKNGKEGTPSAKMVKEGDLWKWDET
jgi:hypothetical protein